ncbi:MAG: hypothetical protein IPK16_32890 [Anaerolineales bacterium]|nr:hypothetical protein [Anaerolineales bacterium]
MAKNKELLPTGSTAIGPSANGAGNSRDVGWLDFSTERLRRRRQTPHRQTSPAR